MPVAFLIFRRKQIMVQTSPTVSFEMALELITSLVGHYNPTANESDLTAIRQTPVATENQTSLVKVVAQIQSLPKNLTGVTWATVPLDEVLIYQPEATFDVQQWNEQWATIESRMKLQESLHTQAKHEETWTDIY
jgi:hypothetical protein